MNYSDVLSKVATANNMPVDFVRKVYRTYWSMVRDIIQGLPLKEDMSEEEFKRLRPNINIPSLGKLHVLYPKYVSLKKRYQSILDKQKQKKTHVDDTLY